MVDAELLMDICLPADDYASKHNLKTSDVWENTEHDVEVAVRRHIAERAEKPYVTTVKRRNSFGACGRCAAFIDMKTAMFFDSYFIPISYCPNCGAKVVR